MDFEKKVKFLVLGGGYAGVPIAYRLMQQGEDFLLVNNRPYQTLTALLPDLVTGNIRDDDGILWLTRLFDSFLTAQVQEISPSESHVTVITKDGEKGIITYDYLVVALGWAPNFMVPVEGAHVVRDLPSALRVRTHLYEGLGHVIVCGGGFVGVETAGSLQRAASLLGFKVTLVEAADEILPTLPMDARLDARKALDDLGVEVFTGKRVKTVSQGRVTLEDGQVLAGDLVIWAMGVKASEICGLSGFSTDHLGRAKVDPYLRSVDYENVFFAGDCAGTDQPMLGQIAVQQGKFLGANLPRLARGDMVDRPEFRYKGLSVKVGDKKAVAALGETITFSGLAAVWLKKMIGKKYFLDIRI